MYGGKEWRVEIFTSSPELLKQAYMVTLAHMAFHARVGDGRRARNNPAVHAALARAKQEALDALPEGYGRADYDPVAGELAMLPRLFTEADLEAVVEERSGVLEVPDLAHPLHARTNAVSMPVVPCGRDALPGCAGGATRAAAVPHALRGV